MGFKEMFNMQIKAIFKNKGLMILMFLGPIFLTLLFGGVYVNNYVKDIPIAILDEDSSTLSNTVSEYFMNDERFVVNQYPSDRDELSDMIESGQVSLGILIPEDFERDVTTYNSGEILTIMDGSNIVVSGNAYAQASTIIQTISAGVEMKLIQGKGLSPSQAENIALVYNVGERILFDPQMTYMNYLMICFLAVFAQQLFLSSMGSMLNRDSKIIEESNTVEKIISTSVVSVIGLFPSIILSFLSLKFLYKVTINGSVLLATVLTIIFMLSLTGPALIMASLTKNKVKYSQISFMLSVPTFVSCGAVWPVDQMPDAFEFIIRLFWPLINYAKLAQEVLIKGRDLESILPNMMYIVAFGIVWGIIGTLIFKKEYSKEVVEKERVKYI